MPAKCPECGHFLRNDFVRDLATRPAPCPRCGTVLTPDRFPADVMAEIDAARPSPQDEVAADAPSAPVVPIVPGDPMIVASVRPPDLPPASVRATDPLDGWDEAMVGPPTDGGLRAALLDGGLVRIAAVAGAGLAGGVAGRALAKEHRGLGALAGGLVGAGAALAASSRGGRTASR